MCCSLQDDAKRLVQELVVWPMLNPALCQARTHARILVQV